MDNTNKPYNLTKKMETALQSTPKPCTIQKLEKVELTHFEAWLLNGNPRIPNIQAQAILQQVIVREEELKLANDRVEGVGKDLRSQIQKVAELTDKLHRRNMQIKELKKEVEALRVSHNDDTYGEVKEH